MNVERLTQLIRVLQEVESGKISRPWNMSTWFGQEKEAAKELTCQTAACAWGHAAVDPWFQQQGVGVGNSTKGFNFGALVPVFDGHQDQDAAENFFEIGELTAEVLFIPESYPTVVVAPYMVRFRIMELLENTADFAERYQTGDEEEG